MRKRILVVDDDSMCVKLVQRLLKEDYEVITALSGMQATHILEDEEVDLLLLDIEMPGENGFATYENIRKMKHGEKLPVIFITGRTDRNSMRQCASIGASGYIEKPIDKDTLLRRIHNVFC